MVSFCYVYELIQETSIELVVIGEDGIVQSVSEQPVFGIIKDLAILPWKDKFSPRNPQVCELLRVSMAFFFS